MAMLDEEPQLEADSDSGNSDSGNSDSGNSASSQSPVGWNWHHLVLALLAVAFLGYMVALPLASNLLDQFRPQPMIAALEEMSLGEAIRLRAMEALTGLWFMALGGTIGSFLNVVAYRMPRGESVVFRASRCPQCGTRILGKDNIPVIGWLNLGGQCRACRLPISARYPLVEALVATLFFLLFLVQLITGGANLPVRTPPTYTGIVWIIFYTKWDLVLLYLYHCLLISILVAWTLVDVDRQRITLVAKWVAGISLFIPVLIWPFLLPVPLMQVNLGTYNPSWFDSLQVSLSGAVVGLALGISLRALVSSSGHVASGLVLIGLGIGWQAVIAVTLVSLLLRVAVLSPLRLFSRIQVPMMAFVLGGFVLHHLLWRWTIANLSPWWPGPHTSLPGWLAMAAGLAVLLAVNGLLFREKTADRSEKEPPVDLAEPST
jgi:leader peptidase (prepilin peptidase) / N-methyltransferase